MSRKPQITNQPAAEAAQTATNNGHGPDPFSAPWDGEREFADEDTARSNSPPATWYTAPFIAMKRGDPLDDPIAPKDGKIREALGTFFQRHEIDLAPAAVTFGDLGELDVPLPAAIADLLGVDGATRNEIAEHAAEIGLDDPHDRGEAMEDEAAARINKAKSERSKKFREESRARRDLKADGVDPGAEYTIETIETIEDVGPETARRARLWLSMTNRWAWAALKPHSYTEHTDLISAVELHRVFGVEPAVIAKAKLTAATPEEKLDALERLYRARRYYAKFGTEETDIVGGPELFVPREFVRDRTPYLIENLFKGGDDAPSAVLVARRKAGKSTACDELVYSLVTGAKFCGALPTHLPEGSQVVILDTEMSGGDLYDTYVRCRPLLDDGRVKLWKTIGIAGLLDLRDERARRKWDSKIPEHSVIVVDCLSPILSAAGIAENSDEIALIIDGLIALARERRSALFVAHHMGKDEEKGSRGHSSLEGKFGSIIYLTYKGDGLPGEETPRYLEAAGRAGIGLSKRKITRNAEGHLVMDGGDGKTAIAEANAEQRERDEAVFRMLCTYPARGIKALSETHDAQQNKWSDEMIRKSLARLEDQHRAANLGHGGAHQWVPQWLRDPMTNLDTKTPTAENINGLAVEGSTAHEAALRACVEAICAFVKRDPAQENLADTKMEQALRRPGYPPRKIHIAAYYRWKAACENAGTTITDPKQVPTLPTPKWSKGETGYPWTGGDNGDDK